MSQQRADAVFEAAFAEFRQDPGVILFTALRWLPSESVLRRVFTSHPAEYPLGAEKSVEISTGWLETVISKRQAFMAPDAAALSEVFSDVALIQSLGCGAVINVPVTSHEGVVGVLALLDAEGKYTSQSLEAVSSAVSAASDELAAAFVNSDQAVSPEKGTFLP